MHLALITGTLLALLCYIWTCTCAVTLICVMTLSYNIVQIKKKLFQEMYTVSPWFVQPVKKRFLRMITFLTSIKEFYLYSCERIFQNIPGNTFALFYPPTASPVLTSFLCYIGNFFYINKYVGGISY